MKVKVKVIGLESEKISLSIKRLKDNPWDALSKRVKTGDVIKAPISRISQFGAFMDLDDGIQGLIHLSEISHGVVKDIREFVKVGEEVTAKIINFEPQRKRIGLSLKALQEAPAAPAKKETVVKKTEKASEEDKIDAEVAKKAPAKKAAPKKEEK